MNADWDDSRGSGATSGGSQDTESVKTLARRGAFWVSLVTILGIPLAYYRNWILGRIGDDGTVVGTYALILLIIQIVTAFVLFGGSSVVTSYVPKLSTDRQRSRFLSGYAAISFVSVGGFVTLVGMFPDAVELLVRQSIDSSSMATIAALAPVVVGAQVVLFALAGFLEFRVQSILGQVQVLLVSAAGTIGLLFFPELIEERALLVLGLVVGAANVVVITLGCFVLLRRLPAGWVGMGFPRGFWRFAGFVHINTLTTFAYRSIDQVVVLATVGTAELGAYFVLLQYAQLITFVPKRLGQVMLASFAHLSARGDSSDLTRAYRKLARMILIMSTGITLVLVLFSEMLAGLFGDWFAQRHDYLVWLATAIYIGSLGSLNSMLILAKERTGVFLVNNLTQVALQLTVTLALLEALDVYAVIVGKGVGIVAAQIGLFMILRKKLDGLKLSPPREYWWGLIVVAAAAALAIVRSPLGFSWGALGLVTLGVGFLVAIRFRWNELHELRPDRRSTPNAAGNKG